MPSKGRWALNPRRWFGTIANAAAHKRDKKSQITNNPVTPSAIPRLLTRNKIQVVPISSNTDNDYTNSTNALVSYSQFQLPAFNVRREKTSALLISSSTTLFNRTNTLVPQRTQPSIRKNGQHDEELSIDATRWHTQTVAYDPSKLLSPSQYNNFSQQTSTEIHPDINLSNLSDQCLIDYPRNSSNNFLKKSPSPTRTRSSSSIDDNDENDESSSSGIFTDERADLHHRHRAASRDTLSTLEALSIESIADSQTSLNHSQFRPLVHHYRLPMPAYEPIENNKTTLIQRQTPVIRFNRAQSAEGILKNTQTASPTITKSRQSSAAIVKKIEKRMPTSRSPTATLEKSGLVRVANDTYRLTIDKDNHLYHRQRQNSIIQYANYDDSLPPANDEESYATLPRTSSTEQLNNNLQNDLRAIVDDYLRPMVNSVNKTNYRSTKPQHRSKRSQTSNEQVQVNINDLSDKLLSSIDCSIYAQYQRCY